MALYSFAISSAQILYNTELFSVSVIFPYVIKGVLAIFLFASLSSYPRPRYCCYIIWTFHDC